MSQTPAANLPKIGTDREYEAKTRSTKKLIRAKKNVPNLRLISLALLLTKRSTLSCWSTSSRKRASSNLDSAKSGWPGMAMAVPWSFVVCTLISRFREL